MTRVEKIGDLLQTLIDNWENIYSNATSSIGPSMKLSEQIDIRQRDALFQSLVNENIATTWNRTFDKISWGGHIIIVRLLNHEPEITSGDNQCLGKLLGSENTIFSWKNKRWGLSLAPSSKQFMVPPHTSILFYAWKGNSV